MQRDDEWHEIKVGVLRGYLMVFNAFCGWDTSCFCERKMGLLYYTAKLR